VRADPDFSAYVVARWLPVVRVLVVLGQPLDDAEDVAVASFARLLPDWGRLRREGDVDVELARVVLDGWVRTRGQQPAMQVAVPVPAGRVITQELEDQLALLQRLVRGLDRLDETTRVAVVLHHLGELDEQQVADVLGEPRHEVGRRLSEAATSLDMQPLDPTCHQAATAIDVSPPPVATVVARASAAQRRRRMLTSAVAGALVLVAVASYLVSRPDPTTDPGALAISPVENIVDVPWWHDGVLHLHHGTTRVPEVSQLVETSVGVVLADGEGDLTFVAEDGSRRELGKMAPDTALVSQPRTGWVAWTEPGDGDIVVYDATSDRELGTLDTSVDTRLIGWDRERLHFHSEGNDWAATVGATDVSSPHEVDPPQDAFGSVLVDVASGSELRSRRGTLSVVHPFFSIAPEVPGLTGRLSPDGNFVLTEVGGGRVELFDTRSGDRDGGWFDRWGWTPVAGAFTVDGRVVWVVDSHDGGYGLYECQASRHYINSFNPESEPCTQRFDLDGVPLLAGA
jgi:DNA-directed RNA polymerase specialized sigma24 family protein